MKKLGKKIKFTFAEIMALVEPPLDASEYDPHEEAMVKSALPDLKYMIDKKVVKLKDSTIEQMAFRSRGDGSPS